LFLGGFAAKLAIVLHYTIYPGATLRSQEIVPDDIFFSQQLMPLLMFELRD